jgi:copper chaperone
MQRGSSAGVWARISSAASNRRRQTFAAHAGASPTASLAAFMHLGSKTRPSQWAHFAHTDHGNYATHSPKGFMNSKRLQIDIGGMSCGSCVTHVRSALEGLPGIRVENVQVGRAVVDVAPTVDEAAIRTAIADAGYGPTSVRIASAGSRVALPAAPVAAGGCCCNGDHEHAPSSPALQRRPTGNATRARSG